MKTFRLITLWFILFIGLVACGGGSSKSTQDIVHKSGGLVKSSLLASYSKNQVDIEGIDTKYSVKVYRVVYETKQLDGTLIDVSGLVTIPQKPSQAKSPMLAYHHGTVYQNKYAPTESVNKGSASVIAGYMGFIVVTPDYIGYGESHGVLHPYSNAKVTASTSVDLLIATKTLLKKLNIKTNGQLFLGGYSQGGGATLATQKLLESKFTDEFSVTATSAGAGAYALSDELEKSAQTILNNYETFHIVRPSNLGFILKAMDAGYNLKMLNDIFTPKYVSVVDSIYDGLHSAQAIDLKLSHKPSELLKKDFLQQLLNGEKQPLVDAFKDSDLFDWSPEAPTQLYHGKEDDWVSFSHAQKAYDTMRARGVSKLELVECDAGSKQITSHANCFVPYLYSSYKFFLRYATDL